MRMKYYFLKKKDEKRTFCSHSHFGSDDDDNGNDTGALLLMKEISSARRRCKLKLKVNKEIIQVLSMHLICLNNCWALIKIGTQTIVIQITARKYAFIF